jgi:putative ABC transport system permease protein
MSGPVAKTLNPSLFGLRLSMLLHLCRARLRAHPVAELLTAVGVAVGVALVFGVLLANASLTGSAAKLVTGLAGGARIELAAPSPQGFDQRIAEQAGELPGVEVAAPVLRRNVTLSGPRGSEQVQLVGVTPSLEALGGIATQELAAGAQLQRGGLGLPASVAQAIGAGRRARVMIASGAQQRSVQVRALLGSRIASLASSPIAVAVLGLAQRLTYGTGEVTGGAGRVAGGAGQVTGSSGQVAGGSGRVAGGPGRVTEVLVKPLRGHGAQVAGELRHLAGDRLLVRPATAELGMLSLATAPSRQSTALFTAIAVMIGFLLALNATLLTAPERRRFIAELLTQGYETRQVALLLGFQALIVGLIASLAGIVLGALLASALFTHVPGFLSAAFPLGTEEAIAPAAVLAALACGLLASAGASLTALLDPWHARATPDLALQRAALSETVRTESVLRLAGAGLLLLFVAVGLALLMSSLTIVGGVMLALATVCMGCRAGRSACGRRR